MNYLENYKINEFVCLKEYCFAPLNPRESGFFTW